MGVTCQILLTKDVYRTGDLVEGKVKYYVMNDPTEFTSITLSLRREEQSYFYRTPITPKSINIETKNFVVQCMDLLNVEESGTVILPAGTYEKQFSFTLPENTTSSCKDFRHLNSFFVQLEFVKLDPISDPRIFVLKIEVENDPEPDEIEHRGYELKKEFNVMFSKKFVTLRVGVLEPIVFVGEDIRLLLQIANEGKIPLVSIKIELIELVGYKNGYYEKLELVKGSETIFLGISRFQTTFSLVNFFTTTPDMTTKVLRIKVTLYFLLPHRGLCTMIPVGIVEKIDENKSKVLAPTFWQDGNEEQLTDE